MDFWVTAASIAVVVQTIVVTAAAFVAFRQLRETARQRRFESLMSVYRMVGSSSARRDRHVIYNDLPASPSELSDEHRRLVGDVSVMFDHVGAMVEYGLVDEDELMRTHGELFRRLWTALEPYIVADREVLGRRHVAAFERLASRAEGFDDKAIQSSRRPA